MMVKTWLRRKDGRVWHIADELPTGRDVVSLRCYRTYPIDEIASRSRSDDPRGNPPEGRLCNACIGLFPPSRPTGGGAREERGGMGLRFHPDHRDCAYNPVFSFGAFADMECAHGYSATPPFYTEASVERLLTLVDTVRSWAAADTIEDEARTEQELLDFFRSEFLAPARASAPGTEGDA
jgi:hypothetical protein